MRVVWEAWLTPILLDCQAVPCAEAGGCCLVGRDHGAAACGILGTPQGLRCLPGGLLPTHWWLKPGLGVSSRLLAGRAGSWSLVVWLRDPSWCQLTRGGASS